MAVKVLQVVLVGVLVHVLQLVALLEQQRQTQEIIMIHTVVQMSVVNPKLETVIVISVHQLLVKIVNIVKQI